MPAAVRVLGYLLALAAGVAAGVLGSFRFGYTYAWVPVGLLVALGLNLAVFVTAGLVLRARSAAATAAGGWFLTVLVLSTVAPGGDVIVTNTVLGSCWLLVGMLVAVLSLAVPYASGAARTRR